MKQRSIFFPLALIAAGVIWLLISAGKIPSQNLWALAHLWPFLLIAAGLGLILRAYWAPARLVIDVLMVGGAALAIVFAAQLGWATPQSGLGFVFNPGFGGQIGGSGKVISQTREVQAFQTISIDYPAEVLIQQGKAESIKIEAEDNLLPQLSTTVAGGVLTINNKIENWNQRVGPTQVVRITITVKDLRELDFPSAGTVRIVKLTTESLKVRISGAGSLSLEELSAGSLNCGMSGAGSITASGTAGDLSLSISGVGNFDGAGLLGKSADVRISGAGSASVHPQDTLNAQISGAGSIRYYGSPNLSESISGLGSVTRLGE